MGSISVGSSTIPSFVNQPTSTKPPSSTFSIPKVHPVDRNDLPAIPQKSENNVQTRSTPTPPVSVPPSNKPRQIMKERQRDIIIISPVEKSFKTDEGRSSNKGNGKGRGKSVTPHGATGFSCRNGDKGAMNSEISASCRIPGFSQRTFNGITRSGIALSTSAQPSTAVRQPRN